MIRRGKRAGGAFLDGLAGASDRCRRSDRRRADSLTELLCSENERAGRAHSTAYARRADLPRKNSMSAVLVAVLLPGRARCTGGELVATVEICRTRLVRHAGDLAARRPPYPRGRPMGSSCVAGSAQQVTTLALGRNCDLRCVAGTSNDGRHPHVGRAAIEQQPPSGFPMKLADHQTVLARARAAGASVMGRQARRRPSSGDLREFNRRYRDARIEAEKDKRRFPDLLDGSGAAGGRTCGLRLERGGDRLREDL